MTFQPVAGRRSVVIYSVDGGKCAFAPNDVKIDGAYWASSNNLLVLVNRVADQVFAVRRLHAHEYNWMLLVDQNCKNPRMVVPDRSGATNYGFAAEVLSRMPDERHVRVAAGKIYDLDLDTATATALSVTSGSRCDSSWHWVVDGSGKARICYQRSRSFRGVEIYARLAGSDDWVLVYSYPIDEREEKGMSFEGFSKIRTLPT